MSLSDSRINGLLLQSGVYDELDDEDYCPECGLPWDDCECDPDED